MESKVHFFHKSIRSVALLGTLVLFTVSCATYQAQVDSSRKRLKTSPSQAAEALKVLAETESKDQLVYLLDYATALQAAKDYKESTKQFLIADKMVEVKDYHSISKQVGSLVLNEEMVQYKGDDYEKILINAMLAINFLSINDLDGALVETRRLIEKLEHYRVDAKKKYEQNEFAVYLSALIWESDRKWDDAYISYEKAYKLNPGIEYLKTDLIRSAIRARRMETAQEWEKSFGIKRDPKWFNSKEGEIVLIYQQGWGPRKQPNPQWRSIPTLVPVRSYNRSASLEVEGFPIEVTQRVYNLEKVAMRTLSDQYAPLIAKRIAAVATKEVLSEQVRQKNEALGAIMNFALHMADRADLRQWSTLPESFQIAKVRVPAGTYKVQVKGLNSAGQPTGSASEEIELKVKAGRKSFFTYRTYD